MKALSWRLIVRFPRVDLAEGVDSSQSPDLHQGNHLDHQKTLKKEKKNNKKICFETKLKIKIDYHVFLRRLLKWSSLKTSLNMFNLYKYEQSFPKIRYNKI